MIPNRESVVFLSLARNLNFTVTAQELYISQPGVSKIISGIEQRLGAPLFIRNTHGVSLTMLGEAYRDYLLEMVEKYHRIEIMAEQSSKHSKHQFKIAYSDRLAVEPAPFIALKWMEEKYVETDFKMMQYSPNKVIQAIKEKSCDVAVVTSWHYPVQERHLIVEPLCNVPLSLLVSAQHSGNTKRATWENFAKEPLIIPSYQGETPDSYNQRAYTQSKLLGLEPQSIIWASNVQDAFTLTELGMGVFQGFSLIRKPQGRNLVSYPLDKDEQIAAIRYDDDKTGLVSQYCRALRKAYQFQKEVQIRNMNMGT